MKEVFSTVSAVCAWLGGAIAGIDTAIRYVKTAIPVPRKQRRAIIFSKVRKQGMRALRNLVQCEYWSRIWIIQEVVLARSLYLLIGDEVIQWEHLEDVATGNLAPYFSGAQQAVRNTSSGMNFRQTWALEKKLASKKSPNPCLTELLYMFHRAHCQDPRDRLYGLFGPVPIHVRSRVIVDYTSHPIETCPANLEVITKSPWKHVVRTVVISPSHVFTFLDLVFGEGNIPVDHDLPSKLKISLISQAKFFPSATSFVTLAACDLKDGRFQDWAKLDLSRPHDLYMTHIKHNRVQDVDSRYLRAHILYSRVPSREWEFILNLIHIPGFYLVVGKNMQRGQVIDIGTEACRHTYGPVVEHSYFPPRVLDPGQVLKARIPEARYTNLGIETLDDKKRLEMSPHAKLDWRVRLDPSALAEIIGFWAFWKKWREVDAPSFTERQVS